MSQNEIRIVQRNHQQSAVRSASDPLSKARVANHRERFLGTVKNNQIQPKIPVIPGTKFEVGQIWKHKEKEDNEVVILQDLALCLLVTPAKTLESGEFGEVWALPKATLQKDFNMTTDNLIAK